jgi:hypothetical protein
LEKAICGLEKWIETYRNHGKMARKGGLEDFRSLAPCLK